MHLFGPPTPKMICRHSPGDTSCSKYGGRYSAPEPVTPDASKYDVLDAQQVGPHLVMKVKYPNCYRCAFEGVKILVFASTTAMDALKWKRIDPHFRDPKLKGLATDAPSPLARFPGTNEGWSDALDYAKTKRVQA